MHEMMDPQLVKQHRDEMLREVELNRQVKAFRPASKRSAGRRSALVWEIERHAGGLLKFLGILRKAG
jgi:hypothetical protein